MQEPDIEVLAEVLNIWPPDTVGAQRDDQLIRAMFALAKTHGHGRAMQAMKAIHEIWDRPNHLEMYRHFRQKRLETLQENKDTILDET